MAVRINDLSRSAYPIIINFFIKRLPLLVFFAVLLSCSSNQHSKVENWGNETVEGNQYIFKIQQATIVLLYKLQKDIALESEVKDSSFIRNRVLDSIFYPNKNLFSYCLGYEKEQFADKYTTAFLTRSDSILAKSKIYETNDLDNTIIETIREISTMSPVQLEGRYTIGFFEDAGCIMCGCDNHTMLGNTYNSTYEDKERLKVVIAHELNHNFYETTRENDPDRETVLYKAIDEGFANMFSMKILEADHLVAFNVTNMEYQWLVDHEPELKKEFREVIFSTKEEDWDPYSEKIADRILEGSPGDVGYFIGFRIIESWLQNDKSRNWKDVYDTDVRNLLQESNYFDD